MVFALATVRLWFLLLLSLCWWRRLRGLCKPTDRRDWWWEKQGLALLGRALLSKTLIHLSADEWGYVPFLLIVWSESIHPWGLPGSMIGLMANSRSAYVKGTLRECYCQRLCPPSEPLPTHASTGDFPTLAGSVGSVFCGVTASFLWVLPHAKFCLCPQDWSLCFPQSCESPIIKSCWPPRSYSYCIAAASSLSLGYLIWWVPSFSCQWLFNS